MCGSMVDIQCAAAEIRRGKKRKIEDRKELQDENIMVCPITYGDHKKSSIGANCKECLTAEFTGHTIVRSASIYILSVQKITSSDAMLLIFQMYS